MAGKTSNPYIIQQVKNATPEKLILMLYEVGIKSCQAKDHTRAVKVVTELIAALNFEYKEISLRLFDLYRYALDQLHNRKFGEALTVLEGLHDVWESAVINKNAAVN